MGTETDEVHCSALAEERLNILALVIYIPDPLGRFLDELRRELVPSCRPRAHISVLPPRPLSEDWKKVSKQVSRLMDGWAPFEIELQEVEIFKATDVVYIEVGAGAEELRRLHAAMNEGFLEFQEPFEYHPHVTLAQEIPPERVPAIYHQARQRWQEYRGPRSFRAEQAALVQNTANNCWIDLAAYSLGAVFVP